MELRHIRSFLSLAKTLNFSRTAEIVRLSQPALSLQVQALENEIGVKLSTETSADSRTNQMQNPVSMCCGTT
jgi:DNA-binding transcriptional LysR family regulator